MNARRLILLGAVLALALSCSRSVEPGLYTVQGGYVRVYQDSLGNMKALMYRDTSALWADTLTIDLKEQKLVCVFLSDVEQSINGFLRIRTVKPNKR